MTADERAENAPGPAARRAAKPAVEEALPPERAARACSGTTAWRASSAPATSATTLTSTLGATLLSPAAAWQRTAITVREPRVGRAAKRCCCMVASAIVLPFCCCCVVVCGAEEKVIDQTRMFVQIQQRWQFQASCASAATHWWNTHPRAPLGPRRTRATASKFYTDVCAPADVSLPCACVRLLYSCSPWLQG